MGDSPCVYYFGHIGYHVDPPWRGHHYAARACALLAPLIAVAGKSSVVITADPDNFASRRTCERLGCVLAVSYTHLVDINAYSDQPQEE